MDRIDKGVKRKLQDDGTNAGWLRKRRQAAEDAVTLI